MAHRRDIAGPRWMQDRLRRDIAGPRWMQDRLVLTVQTSALCCLALNRDHHLVIHISDMLGAADGGVDATPLCHAWLAAGNTQSGGVDAIPLCHAWLAAGKAAPGDPAAEAWTRYRCAMLGWQYRCAMLGWPRATRGAIPLCHAWLAAGKAAPGGGRRHVQKTAAVLTWSASATC